MPQIFEMKTLWCVYLLVVILGLIFIVKDRNKHRNKDRNKK